MTTLPDFDRVAVVVHPARPLDSALAALSRWAQERDVELVQPAEAGRRVAAAGEVGGRDLVVALGGDGTVLNALRLAAAANTAVLGVACGSLGALTSVAGGRIADALERAWAGDWTPRSLPALAVGDERALNDFVLVRRGAGQLATSVSVDGELYARLSGDGVIVATALGSSAYSMAAGGPLLPSGTPAYLCTPLAMHGGSAPPLVLAADARLTLDVQPGHAGFEIEVDGRRRDPGGLHFEVTLHDDHATLVTYEPPGRGFTALRSRGVLADSPRILARDARATSRPPGAA